MNNIWNVLLAWGIPSAIIGFVVWLLKREMDKNEAKREAREKKTEKLIMMVVRTSQATNVLAEATARAVQRIPDAHCNGDMTSALSKAQEIQSEEFEFLMDQGIQHIVGD